MRKNGKLESKPNDLNNSQNNAEAEENGKEKSLLKTKGRKNPILIGGIVLAVVLVAAIILGTFWIIDAVTFVSTDDAVIDGNHVNISSKILGRIKDLLVFEGMEVTTGQLLVLLDDTDLRFSEQKATADLNSAKQSLILAKVDLEKNQDDLQRTTTLYNSGATTREQYDHASKAYETANAKYGYAQAQVEIANAQLGIIETQFLNTRITAPISGFIAKRVMMTGDVVQPGQTIFTVNDLKNVWVTANFEETKINRIRVEAEVEITVDAYPDYPFKGRVAQISAGIVPPPFSIGEFTKTTQRIPVRIILSAFPESKVLLPGMSVEVKVRAR